MAHDPLCVCEGDDGLPCEPDSCAPIRVGECACACDYIGKVRADEREKAAQRVGAVHYWYDMEPPPTAVVHRDIAIAAARGEA